MPIDQSVYAGPMYSDANYDPSVLDGFKRSASNNQPFMAFQLLIPIIEHLLEEVSDLKEEIAGMKGEPDSQKKTTASSSSRRKTANKASDDGEV